MRWVIWLSVEAWDLLHREIESELIDAEAVLGDLDNLDALRARIRSAEADGSIGQRPVLKRCAELI